MRAITTWMRYRPSSTANARIASVTCTGLSRVYGTHVVGRISRSRDWDRMVRLWAGSLGRVSDRETKYLEDDRCHRSFRLYYRELYLSWLERRCGYSFHRLFHWIINTRRADSFDVLRSQRPFQIRRPVGKFSVAKIRSIKWKIVNATWVEKKMQMSWCNLLLAKVVFTFYY